MKLVCPEEGPCHESEHASEILHLVKEKKIFITLYSDFFPDPGIS